MEQAASGIAPRGIDLRRLSSSLARPRVSLSGEIGQGLEPDLRRLERSTPAFAGGPDPAVARAGAYSDD